MISTEHDLRNHMNAARPYVCTSIQISVSSAVLPFVFPVCSKDKNVLISLSLSFSTTRLGVLHAFCRIPSVYERPRRRPRPSDHRVPCSSKIKRTSPGGAVTTVSRTRRRVRVHCSRQYCLVRRLFTKPHENSVPFTIDMRQIATFRRLSVGRYRLSDKRRRTPFPTPSRVLGTCDPDFTRYVRRRDMIFESSQSRPKANNHLFESNRNFYKKKTVLLNVTTSRVPVFMSTTNVHYRFSYLIIAARGRVLMYF